MAESLPSQETRTSTTKSNRRQYVAAFVVNLLLVSNYVGAHSHITIFNDYSNDWSDYLEYMDVTFSVVGTLSYLLSAFMFQNLSRKTCAYIPCVGFMVTCIVHECSRSAVGMFFAHVCRTFSAAVSNMMTVIYISETAHDDVRGTLLLIGDVMYNMLHTVVFCIEQIHPFTFSWFVMLPPAVVIVCFIFWLPDTPIYFLRQGNKTAAEHSMMWLRGSTSPEDVAAELEKKNQMLITTRSDSSSTTSVFREFLSRRSLKYTGIMIVLYLTNQFSGIGGVYMLLSTPYFSHSIWLFRIVYIQFGFACVLGNIISIIICDRKGRRYAMLISTIICSITLIPIAICAHVADYITFSIDEIFAFIFKIVFSIAYYIGLRNVITMLVADIFPPKTLNAQLALNGMFITILNSLNLHFILNNNEFSSTSPRFFWFNTAVCVAGSIFIFKFLPETKQQPTGFLFMERRVDVLLSSIQNN